MSKTSLDRVLGSIDRNLPYLHKERWALEASKLRSVVRSTTGDEQEAAKQALQAHYDTLSQPESSRGPLVQQAMENDAAQRA